MNKFLIAPLDWGLGHATRCIPIVDELLRNDQDVVLSASGGGYHLLKQRFPDLSFINIPATQIHYPNSGRMALSMMSQAKKILNGIALEHKVFNELVAEKEITHVISDNRYGLHSTKTHSVLITHQLNIQTPGLLSIIKPLLNMKMKYFLGNFDEIWIPDLHTKECLSGILTSTKWNLPKIYIGPLSRFKNTKPNPVKKYDIIGMVSGPEPQRGLFFDLIREQMIKSDKECLLISGLPDSKSDVSAESKITIRNHITDEEFLKYLHSDTIFITRSGYSTIMDLASLGHKKNILVPTPGQTEQEYLASFSHEKFNVTIQHQHQINFLNNIDDCIWPQLSKNSIELTAAIKNLIN